MISAYEKQFPKEESPRNFLISFGEVGMFKILQAREGRKIVFKSIPKTNDGYTYEYKEPSKNAPKLIVKVK